MLNKLKLIAVFILLVGAREALADGSHGAPGEGLLIDKLEKVRSLPARSYYGRSYSGEKKVALTFDDGPFEYYTEKVLDILKDHDVKATFFLVGFRMEEHPDIVKRIYAEGHAVGLHSYSHTLLLEKSNDELHEEIVRNQQVFETILGIKPNYFRAPFGKITSEQVRFLADRGIQVIAWSITSYDFRQSFDAAHIVEQVKKKIFPGEIILMHERAANNENTIIALPHILEFLKGEGYRFYLIPELLNESNLPSDL